MSNVLTQSHPPRKPILERVYGAARSVWTSLAITVLIMFIGVWASLFFDEIKGAFPFRTSNLSSSLDPNAAVFWTSFVMAAALFGIRQRALDRVQDEMVEATKRMDLSTRSLNCQVGTISNATDKLMQAIRTMPDGDYLETQLSVYQRCERRAYDALANTSSGRDDIIHALGDLLSGIAILAREFDGGDDGVQYAANIMLALPVGQLSDTKKQELEEQLLFRMDTECLERMHCVLELRPDLSATTWTQRFTEQKYTGAKVPDGELTLFALGIPIRDNDPDQRMRLLPGAPMAYTRKIYQYYADTAALQSWLDANTDQLDAVKRDVIHYFTSGAGQYIKSWVSCPLIDPGSDPAQSPPPFAILNIHSDRVSMLSAGEATRLFFGAISPIIVLLNRLLLRLSTLENWTKG
ncbi:MAG TPA: hypothetical protein VHI13_01235 [Candidatus Kapabacteria bacterium]|nr:hypothetical protein [Candidatus Kapabacteria bacterium]